LLGALCRLPRGKAMTTTRKVLLILALVYGIPLAAIAVLAYLWLRDDPPPYDDDLKVQRIQIPEDKNALTFFLEAVENLDMPQRSTALDRPVDKRPGETDDDVPQNERDLFDKIQAGKRWDGPFVEQVLKRNAEALALWEKGMAAPHFQTFEVKTCADEITHVFSYLYFANLVTVRARAAAKRGDSEAALADGLKLVRFGRRIEGDKGCLVEYLVGLTIKNMGMEAIRQALLDSTLPPARLRYYARELAKYPIDVDGLADAFRNEYVIQIEVIDGFASHKHSPASLISLLGSTPRWPSPYEVILWEAIRPITFKPEATRRTFAENARFGIQNVPKPFRDMAPEDPSIHDFSRVREAFSGNLLGRECCRMLVGGAWGVLEQKCRANAQLAATRILLAMKAYKLDKGTLPKNLDELVPQYLDAVPIDDYDGKPMRYNAAKKVVYSVGRDLKDGGGMTMEDYLKVRRKEVEESGMSWDEEAEAEQVKDIWHWPDPSFEIKF
jgi:hypothetical protein